MECSSKEMNGVEEIFERAVTMAVGDEKKSWNGSSDGSSSSGRRKKRSACKLL